MFGMGFFEIFVVVVIAIIFLGPEKLPGAMIDLAKFFRAVKKTMDDAKSSIDQELNIAELKKEALQYKESIAKNLDEINADTRFDTFDSPLDVSQDTKPPLPKEPNTPSSQSNQTHTTPHQPEEIGYKKDPTNV
ncbi:twin arginine-targeting protein translocase TatB [Helicobacter enhydrae]|uniref:Sec-independent protein translocase protein TatB homolog n=1 Tax=Helicobacter enhydrae TaxID=222136 RepID=A0A1B1U5C1_9HELI|nr:Sec-independent protein translocase protein TatB [Helicobacter enhydrae]ANV97948.1 twin arginine-targeting protein translocase TatB [Helicobacter enhydrae]